MNVAFQTFGCRLNRAEALDQEARLVAEGHAIVSLDGGTHPDLIVVRGCSVTARAERDCRKAIAHLHSRFPSSRIEITGCLGTPAHDSRRLPLNFQLSAPVPLRTARAYLKVQDGCSGLCAFCIVPSFRGGPRSVPFAQILARAQAFLASGYREIVVTGCNLALYRDSGHGLADVLAALAALGTDPAPRAGTGPMRTHRIRLSSLEPGVCDDAVLDAFATHPNICRFMHLSVQSGSVPILARMNRPYTIEAVDRFCYKAAKALGPRLALGADIITGFPGETEADFAATRDFLARHPFANLHVFPYSERPGTSAATMDGSVQPALRRTRAKELEKTGRAKREAFAQTFLGQEVEVCIERDGTGWTAEYLKCAVKDLNLLGRQWGRRSLVKARVVRVEGDRLIAVPSAAT
ncbi:MAG: radical SAM protein [Kiritimatiellae bacterium]|nr:radical SAM protein [Kiritimatiellia bacterium]